MANDETKPSSEEAKPKKKMKLWKKILLGVAVFILLVIILAFYATSGIVKVAEKQLNLIASGDLKGAYALTSNDFQKSVSYDKFLAYVNNYEVLKNYKDHKFSSREINGDTGTIQGTLTAKDGTAAPVEYKFIKENGEWKILSVDLSTNAGANTNSSSGATAPTAVSGSNATPSATATDASLNTFSDPALGYSIQYPKDWTMEKKDAVTVLFRATADVTLDIQNLQSSNRGGKYTDNNDVVKDLKNQLKSMDKNVKFNDIPDMTMQRSDGLELTAKGFAAKLFAQGKNFVFMYIVVPHGDSLTFHELEFMAPVDSFDKYSDTMKSVLETWKINK
ncbi:MAG: DUF4864 domain-containing protein [Candidatus Moranbacteria bacterium]|nr:DUF4864 domain-containing protein [Candidatus Moranbacteria bacterium]